MTYTPEEELAEIKRLIETAEHLTSRIQRMLPAGSAWLHWRLNSHQRTIQDIHREMARLVDEAQEAMLRRDSGLLIYRGEYLAELDYRSLPETALPYPPEQYRSKGIFEITQDNPEALARWKTLWEQSKRDGTASAVAERESVAGVPTRYVIRVNMKPNDERHIYVRPVALKGLPRTRRTTR